MSEKQDLNTRLAELSSKVLPPPVNERGVALADAFVALTQNPEASPEEFYRSLTGYWFNPPRWIWQHTTNQSALPLRGYNGVVSTDEYRIRFKNVAPEHLADELHTQVGEAVAELDRQFFALLSSLAMSLEPVPASTPEMIRAAEAMLGAGTPTMAWVFDPAWVREAATNAEFQHWFDPVSRLEILQRGHLGCLFGADVYTDFYRDPAQKFLEHGMLLGGEPPETFLSPYWKWDGDTKLLTVRFDLYYRWNNARGVKLPAPNARVQAERGVTPPVVLHDETNDIVTLKRVLTNGQTHSFTIGAEELDDFFRNVRRVGERRRRHRKPNGSA